METNQETTNNTNNDLTPERPDGMERRRRPRFFPGLILIVVGVAFLAREAGAGLPWWLFTWPMILILVGVGSFFKHRGRNAAGLAIALVGCIFLAGEINPSLHADHFVWPMLFIIAGLFFILRPRGPRRCGRWTREEKEAFKARFRERYDRSYRDSGSTQYETAPGTSGDSSYAASEDFIEHVVFLAGLRKTLVSKRFRGGDVTCVFGGAEIDLSQADIEGRATLEITQVFGGTKLIVPTNWNVVNSEVNTVLGSVEDKRSVTQAGDPNKTLVLRGTSVFGGIEIRNY